MVTEPKINTDREIWRETKDDYYAPSMHVTISDGIGINVGGTVFLMPIRAWHALACQDKKQLDISIWKAIESAPHDRRILVWTGQEIYAARWAKNPYTNDEAWIVVTWGSDGDQALVKPTHWMELPPAPDGKEKP